MAQYIQKSALVAEIERRIVEYKDMKIDSSYYEGMVASLEFFRDEFINTLEAEEVDLEKEIQDIFQKYKNGYNGLLICKKEDFSVIAKHFFELGIQVSNKSIERSIYDKN